MSSGIEASITRNGVTAKWDEVGSTVTLRTDNFTLVLSAEDWDEFQRWILLARNGFEPVEIKEVPND